MSREIELSQGKVAIVDDEDYEMLIKGGLWSLNNFGYAYRMRHRPCSCGEGKIRYGQLMHRIIMDAPKGMQVDHINHDRVDNRRSNLRICTAAQNLRNRSVSVGNQSGYVGVNWHKLRQKWVARARSKEKQVYLGIFESAREAAVFRENYIIESGDKFMSRNFRGE